MSVKSRLHSFVFRESMLAHCIDKTLVHTAGQKCRDKLLFYLVSFWLFSSDPFFKFCLSVFSSCLPSFRLTFRIGIQQNYTRVGEPRRRV